ncbi:MAG: hypothetical protein FWE61_01245 [Micrococcales bacterium]|nr:hypothetical protein [Micrococcales bacterium]
MSDHPVHQLDTRLTADRTVCARARLGADRTPVVRPDYCYWCAEVSAQSEEGT